MEEKAQRDEVSVESSSKKEMSSPSQTLDERDR
jgi:hypothetical protein